MQKNIGKLYVYIDTGWLPITGRKYRNCEGGFTFSIKNSQTIFGIPAIIIHEMSHALVLLLLGIKVHKICFLWFASQKIECNVDDHIRKFIERVLEKTLSDRDGLLSFAFVNYGISNNRVKNVLVCIAPSLTWVILLILSIHLEIWALFVYCFLAFEQFNMSKHDIKDLIKNLK